MENFEIQKSEEEILSDEEIGALREELEEMKKEAMQKEEEYKIKKENFPNDELVGLDLDKLAVTDWFLYKLYKEGKLNYKILNHHRAKDLEVQTTEILEKAAKKEALVDYTELPREQYLAWLSNKWTDDEVKKKLEARRLRKAA